MAETKKNLVFEVDAQQYNVKLAEALKSVPEFQVPDWADFVKSSSSKERPIEDPDFWYKRAASVLKQIYKMKVVGVNRLRTKYGSKKNRGMKPERFVKSGGKIIRTILQQADKAGFTESVKDVRGLKSKRMGRKLTDKGRKFMEEIK
jgi:small subunit ribosomal protein S19e